MLRCCAWDPPVWRGGGETMSIPKPILTGCQLGRGCLERTQSPLSPARPQIGGADGLVFGFWRQPALVFLFLLRMRSVFRSVLQPHGDFEKGTQQGGAIVIDEVYNPTRRHSALDFRSPV